MLTAEPTGYSAFDGWSGACNGTGSCTVTMDAAKNVGAVFTKLNGTCGSSNGATFTIAPSDNLCTTGTASTVYGSGPWNWTCSGSVGTTVICSANNQAATGTTTLKGDVNADGKIDIFDALLTLQYGLNLIPHDTATDAKYLASADVAPLDPATMKPKGDARIDVMDALVILQRAVNLVSW